MRIVGMRKASYLLVLLSFVFVTPPLVCGGEWSGYIAGEYRYFPHDPIDPRQHGNNYSIAFEPEYYTEWSDGQQSLTIVPYARFDQHDDKRSHFDLREFTWLFAEEVWELRVGIRKLFWGVTESQHLVDIINQTDLVEFPDGEQKLGQPMINLAFIQDWGTIDLFVLPYFRERTFPGVNGRLRSHPRVDVDRARYESSREETHIDCALRWAHSIDYWDIGLSEFYGTSRDPSFILEANTSGENVFIPIYNIIHQTGLDIQATVESWLWKLEVIRRSGQGETYSAATGGLEYTFFGLFDTGADLGLVVEYLYDDRGEDANTPFEDDIFAGVRFTLNDVQSTEALLGIVSDREDEAVVYALEASRRIADSWTLEIDARVYTNISASDPLYSFRNDDFLQLVLAYHF